MAKLPRAADVPSVTSGRDPGVRVPEGAFASPVGIVAEGVAPGIEKFAEVKLKQENRRDTIDRADQLNRFRQETEEELRRVQAEEDLSRDETIDKFGRFMAERQQELFNEHGGSQDSRAKLIMRMSDINAEFTGQAAGISAKIGREKVETLFNAQLNPLITKAAQNPSIDNVNKLFIDFETVIDDMRGVFDPSQEEVLRQAGRQHIALATLDPLLIRGETETAETMLTEGGLSKHLSAKAQINVRRRIETIRFNKEQIARQPGPLVEIGDPTSPTGTRFVTRAQAIGKPGKPRIIKPIKVPSGILQETVLNRIDTDPTLGELEELDKGKAAFRVASRVEELLKEQPGINADQALEAALEELSDNIVPGEKGTFDPRAIFTEERFGFDAPPTIKKIPEGLPEGTEHIGGGKFKLPDGTIVREKK